MSSRKRFQHIFLCLIAVSFLVGVGCKKEKKDNPPPPTNSGGGIQPPPNPQPPVQTFTLKVTKDGTGEGTLSSSPVGIDCGTDCSEDFTENKKVTLSAKPADSLSVFKEWAGDCSGTGDCVVTMSSAKNVTATFEKVVIPNHLLTIKKAGNGEGTVSSNPTGIDCGTDCSESYKENTTVTVTATPADSFSIFTGWAGDCSGTGNCVVTMDRLKNVTAEFEKVSFSLTVNTSGNGSGTVSSHPSGIDCGTDCDESFLAETSVTLTATPADSFSTFIGWSGDCSGTGSCVVAMDGVKSVTAIFEKVVIPNHLLTISRVNGDGTVLSSPPGIDCGIDCSESYEENTIVTLTATPANAFSTFIGWSGACSGTGSCVVTMSRAKDVTAEFKKVAFSLMVNKSGNGSGTVSSHPSGIDCGADCDESFLAETSVTLTATPADSFSIFTGWTGDCSGTGDCTVTMDHVKNVTAVFTKVSFSLMVNKSGNGSGSVSSHPSGIDCGTDCDESFLAETSVTLTATPADSFSTFIGWSGDCSGTGSCVVAMDSVKNVTAEFGVANFNLSVVKAGDGGGTVTSVPAGIDCGVDCSEDYKAHSSITLTATPSDSFSQFTGWSGGCTGTGTCVISMDQAQSVTATFELVSFPLGVSKTGDGTGRVTSNPAGIDCGGDCSEDYKAHTVVTLTASPSDSRNEFKGWSGSCSGTQSCTLTMEAAKNVTAEFSLKRFDLVVGKSTNGSGTVTSTPPGIDCGSDCSESFLADETVELSVRQNAGYFLGWQGDCTGTKNCTLQMDGDKNVTAVFDNVSIDGDYCISRPDLAFCFFIRGNQLVQTALRADASTVCRNNFYFPGNLIVNYAFDADNGLARVSGEFLSAFDVQGTYDASRSPCSAVSTDVFDFEASRDIPAGTSAARGFSSFGSGERIPYDPNAK